VNVSWIGLMRMSALGKKREFIPANKEFHVSLALVPEYGHRNVTAGVEIVIAILNRCG
jgi:hypothetical protein